MKQHKHNASEAERIAANIDMSVRLAAVKALSKLDVLAAPYDKNDTIIPKGFNV